MDRVPHTFSLLLIAPNNHLASPSLHSNAITPLVNVLTGLTPILTRDNTVDRAKQKEEEKPYDYQPAEPIPNFS